MVSDVYPSLRQIGDKNSHCKVPKNVTLWVVCGIHSSLGEMIVFRVAADPKPEQAIVDLNGQCAIAYANAYRPEPSDFLEV